MKLTITCATCSRPLLSRKATQLLQKAHTFTLPVCERCKADTLHPRYDVSIQIDTERSPVLILLAPTREGEQC